MFKIKKRDGRVVPFDSGRIYRAIYKASCAVGEGNEELANKLTDEVVAKLEVSTLPTVASLYTHLTQENYGEWVLLPDIIAYISAAVSKR